jgi:hypothetical protein
MATEKFNNDEEAAAAFLAQQALKGSATIVELIALYAEVRTPGWGPQPLPTDAEWRRHNNARRDRQSGKKTT